MLLNIGAILQQCNLAVHGTSRLGVGRRNRFNRCYKTDRSIANYVHFVLRESNGHNQDYTDILEKRLKKKKYDKDE